jgi:hypothetical protein
MSICSRSERTEAASGILKVGLFVGLAGGLAEIAIIWLYSAATGGDAAMVARHVAAAVDLDHSTAVDGLAVHMGLAVALGIGLTAAVRVLGSRLTGTGAIFCFMLGVLAAIWAINYFVILPVVSPAFVHLLPFAVTLTSKLAFGVAAAMALSLFNAGSAIAENLDLAGSLR